MQIHGLQKTGFVAMVLAPLLRSPLHMCTGLEGQSIKWVTLSVEMVLTALALYVLKWKDYAHFLRRSLSAAIREGKDFCFQWNMHQK